MDYSDLYVRNRETARKEIHRSVSCTAKPLCLFLLLTERCNLRCVMCYQRGGRDETVFPYVLFDRIRGLLPYLKEITWQGGEVFVVDYFRELMASLFAGYPLIKHYIITNGLLIDDRWAELLGRMRLRLNLSIDSVVRETYEDIRRGADFSRVLETIRLMNRAMAPGDGWSSLGVNVVVMKRNLEELHLFPDFCRRNDIRRLRFVELNRTDELEEENLFAAGNRHLLPLLRRQVETVERELQGTGVEFECVFRPLLDDGRGSAGRTGALGPDPDPDRFDRCIRPWTNVFVDSRGNVRPYCVCDIPVGNLHDDAILDIWNGERMREYRRRIIEGSAEGWCARRCIEGLIDRKVFTMD